LEDLTPNPSISLENMEETPPMAIKGVGVNSSDSIGEVEGNLHNSEVY